MLALFLRLVQSILFGLLEGLPAFFLSILQASVIHVMEVSLDVVCVAIHITEEELGDGGLANGEFFGQSKDKRLALLVLVDESLPPPACAVGCVFPVYGCLHLIEPSLNPMLAPAGGVADAVDWEISGW